MSEREFISTRPDVSLTAALALMREKGVRHLLVFENDQLVGFVSDRDILDKGMSHDLGRVRADMVVRDVMQADIPQFPDSVESDSIEAKAKFLASNPLGIRLIELLTDIGL